MAMCLFLINLIHYQQLLISETVLFFSYLFGLYVTSIFGEVPVARHNFVEFILALATLARPTTQYLIAMFPLACGFIDCRYKRIALTFKRFSQGIVATGLAIFW